MSAGEVINFPLARIVDPILASAQRIEALPVNERRYPEMPWAIYRAVLLLDVAKAACMSERRGSRQRAVVAIDLAIKQLREAADTSKAVARDDVGKAMREVLGASALPGGGVEAIQEMLSMLFYALAGNDGGAGAGGDDGDGAA